MSYLKLENINYKYPLTENNVLKNINLDIKKGEFWAVVGKNGSGKTTLCNVLRGFVPDFYKGELTGEVTLEGRKLSEYTQGEIVQKIGYVFQNPFTQISGVKETVFEEIAFGLENLGIESENIRKKVEEILELLQIGNLRDKNPYELSGGQGQKVALASIIAMDPEILIIDEPTSQLDPQGTEDIFKIINIMTEKGKTIILVEHKIELIAEYAEKIIVIDDGEIILRGDTKDILRNKLLAEKEIGIPQYTMLAYEIKSAGIELEEIPVTKNGMLKELKKYISVSEKDISENEGDFNEAYISGQGESE